MNIELYINNKRVDLNDNVAINYTYQLEDMENPAAIKNNFTKSIVLDGTKTNNSIFNDIYKLDRNANLVNGYYIGSNFNPSQRTPFYIMKNGELLESGYMQLTEILRKNNSIQYKINLYGGLGDFFYNLKYKDSEDESIKTLADIDYFEGGKDELNIKVNKNTVYQSFMRDYSKPVTDKDSFICFLPGYNGLYEDFENAKVIINCNESIFPATVTNENGKSYYAIDNYIKCEVKNEMTEWDIRDLRSHKQRIGVKTNKLIESICDSRNNGGYTVELDELFFNDKNPYWNDTIIAFPIQTGEENNTYISINGELFNLYKETPTYNTLGFYGRKHYANSAFHIGVKGDGIPFTDGYLDVSEFPVNSIASLNIPVRLLCKDGGSSFNELHIGFLKRDDDEQLYDGWIDLQLVAYNENNTEIGSSRTIRLCGKTDAVVNDTDGYVDQQIVQGSFKTSRNGYVFTTNDGGNVLDFRFDNIRIDGNQIRFRINMQCNKGITSYNMNYNLSTTYDAYNSTLRAGYFQLEIADDTEFKFSYLDDVMSNMTLTKNRLFKNENSCLDYLLSYCKLFNLSFIKDKYTNTIEILTKNTLYGRNKVIEFSNKIDYEKDINISPIIYDNKFYQLKYADSESYYLNKYKNDYSNDYGQKRINTNYNFNLNTKQVFEDLVFNNVVDITDSSKYYRTYYISNGTPLPPFLLNDDVKFSYYAYEVATMKYTDEMEVEIKSSDYPIDLYNIISWNSLRGSDNKVMPCFYGDDKALADISSTLLFYNGIKDMKDMNNNPIVYTISDDLPVMMENEEYTPCFLYTTTTENKLGETIAVLTDKLPQYSRCYYNSDGKIIYSLDFGVPQEMYYQEKQNEENTIYHLFYKRLFTDKFNINTKKLTCYVNLRGMDVNEDLFRNFYMIDGSIFILNKIVDYSINGSDTTKCEFIQVQDRDNYLNAQLGVSMIRLMTRRRVV